MDEKDLYSILGVAKNASTEDIKKAYRRLAREHHPDVNPNNPKAEERFKEISVANSVLSDEEKRKRYDEFGTAGLAEGFDPEAARNYQRWSHGAHQSPNFGQHTSDGDLDDLVANVFGGSQGFRGGRQATGPMQGPSAEGRLEVAFLDAVLGAEVPANFQGRPAMRVKIPAGASEGARIRLAGKGEPGRNGGPPGDLFLTLHLLSHPFYQRDGDDLQLELPVTLPELILGASIDVPTPHGSVSMQIPPGSQNGQKLRLRGKGALRAKGKGHGDLFVKFSAVLPKAGEPRIEELARELEEFYAGSHVRSKLGVD
jgi:DnaJ-class molecular chaperone